MIAPVGSDMVQVEGVNGTRVRPNFTGIEVLRNVMGACDFMIYMALDRVK